MSEHLTDEDVIRLLKDPSPEHRAALAGKVAKNFDQGELSTSERKLAEDIIRLMARDAMVRVRESLAEHLKSSPNLPRDVALIMAQDVEQVALPVLSFSRILTDSDLAEVIQAGSDAKLTAIARRPEVSETVAGQLIARGSETTVATLVGNAGATIGEAGLNQVVDRFGASSLVQEPLVRRAKLPLTVAERLVTLVSEGLQQYLVSHHDLSPDLAADLVLQSRERATVGLVSGEDDDVMLMRLVSQLKQGGRLTASLLLRGLCTGDVSLFEAGMAGLTGIPLPNARLLIHDGGGLGLKSLYARSELPPALFRAVRVALDVARETPFDGEEGDRERHRRRTIERILTQYEEMAPDDVDYLLSKLGEG